MKTSAICNKCGNLADAEYGSFAFNDTTDTHEHDRKRVVRIHCTSCGQSERSPQCQLELLDAKLVRMLVL
jgi:hypothetical protein